MLVHTSMRKPWLSLVVCIATFAPSLLWAQSRDANLLPKYGECQKTEGQKQADAVYLSAMDTDYHGDRVKASQDVAMRGWQYLSSGDAQDAMRRFNQAWLLDPKDGIALWGMGAVQADAGQLMDALKLFAEAEKPMGDNLNFSIDYARVVGLAGAESHNKKLLADAYGRFQKIYERAPQNTRNLKNWATTLYAVGNYSDAWAKVKLAEATPDKALLDPKFVEELQARMPRPTT